MPPGAQGRGVHHCPILTGIDDAAAVAPFIKTIGLAGAGTVRRQPVEYDVEKQMQAAPGAQRGNLPYRCFGRTGNPQLRMGRLQVGNQERITPPRRKNRTGARHSHRRPDGRPLWMALPVSGARRFLLAVARALGHLRSARATRSRRSPGGSDRHYRHPYQERLQGHLLMLLLNPSHNLLPADPDYLLPDH